MRPLLDMDNANTLINSAPGTLDGMARGPMEQALMFNAWLSRYHIDLSL